MACAIAGALALGGPVVGLAVQVAPTPAGALGPALTTTTNSISFQATTLGDLSGGIPFTLTNTSASTVTINGTTGFVITGVGANDYTGFPENNCNVDASGNITIAASGQCTFDNFFSPGALGARPATLQILDSASSGIMISFTGTGAIGYYQVSSSGRVAHFGDAAFYGDASNLRLNRPIEGIAQTGDNGGYWLVANDGGIFNYGDAGFFGSAGGLPLNKPIVGMAATGDGQGYWLVASDGGIFAYGNAQFYGSTGALHLVQPIVGMTAMPDGSGYWFSAADGGLFNYGGAPFYGAANSQGIGNIVAMTTDGAPTLQAFLDQPALRSHGAATRPSWGALPHGPHFAGP